MSDPIYNIDEILMTGTKYLEAHPDFKFVGRTQERRGLQEILLQKDNNCIVLTGASGVGMTSLVMGLQAGKSEATTPPKLLNMPFFFLDVDKLFESGESTQINKIFRDVRRRLSATPGSTLVVENMGNFVDSCGKAGCSNLMNALLGDIKSGKYQAILETPYEDLAKVIKYNSEMKATYTLFDVKEPKGEDLDAIVSESVAGLEKFHGIRISKEAVKLATQLAKKYRTGALQALPTGITQLLDRALSSYALKAHSEPIQLAALQKRLGDIDAVLTTGAGPEDLLAMKKEELEAAKAATEHDITEFNAAWDARQAELLKIYTGNRKIQAKITGYEEQLASIAVQDAKDQKPGDTPIIGDSPEAQQLHENIAEWNGKLQAGTAKFAEITAGVNKDLVLGEAQVLDKFSEITGIPVKKLTQSDREKIIGLEKLLNEGVFDQEHATKKVFNAVKNNAAGLADEGKPKGCFLFLGPSGVGKTELVKVLNQIMFDDPNAIFRLDMSEYMDKNATSKLIGPPPGLVGFEAGGALTEAMKTKPIRIVLVDEIEKAHPDVLNLFLQVLDDGRLTDSQGVTVSFEDTYVIFTSNIGQNNFPDRNVNYEDAIAKSIEELKEAGVRNELLNRFGGKRNIIGFYPLEAPTMCKIVRRELNKVNKKLEEKGLKIDLSDAEIDHIGKDLYSPSNGARAVPGFFADEVKPKASDIILETPGARGVLEMCYDPAHKSVTLVEFKQDTLAADADLAAARVPANDSSGLAAKLRQAATAAPG